MIRFLAIFVTLILLSIYSGITLIDRYPPTEYIVEHPQEHEGRMVCLRGTITDISIETESLVQLHLVRHGSEYTAYVPANYLDNPEEGDIVDLMGISHLEEGYVLVDKALHREDWEHEWLFYRSLIGLLVLGALLVVDRGRLKKVIRFG
ncbi:MAG: hypothetical protein R6U44_02090 [Archaeoglobaceae archaeon]